MPAAYALECRHSSWRTLLILLLPLAIMLVMAVLLVLGAIQSPYGSPVYMVIQSFLQMLLAAIVIALTVFCLIRSVFRATAVVSLNADGSVLPGFPAPLRVDAPALAHATRIAAGGLAAMCTFGAAWAYYIPWCITTIGSSAIIGTERLPSAANPRPGPAIHLKPAPDRKTSGIRSLLLALLIPAPMFGNFLWLGTSSQGLQSLESIDPYAPDAVYAAAMLELGLSMLAFTATAMAVFVTLGWYFCRTALERLSIVPESGAPVSLTVCSVSGPTLRFLLLWWFALLASFGMFGPFFLTTALKRACNHARGTRTT